MLALVTDLIFSTKITSTAESLGLQVKVVRSLEALEERLANAAENVVMIDLNAEGVDSLRAIEVCRNSPRPPMVIAYASHVDTELINAAREAGADQVMARSAFVNKLPSMLMNGLRRRLFGDSPEGKDH